MSIWSMFDMKMELMKKIDALEARVAALEGEKATPPPAPNLFRHVQCAVCNLGSYGTATGYVCSRSDCPTRVSC